MVIRFWQILLATCFVDEGSQVADGDWFEHAVGWSRLNYNTIKLTWNAEKLIKHNVSLISVKAKPKIGSGRTENVTLSVESAQVIFGGLKLDTVYVVEVEALHNKSTLANYRTLIQTWPTAPSPIAQPRGVPVSSTQIELSWSEPTHFNGVLNPYRVICYSPSLGSHPIRVTTVDAIRTFTLLNNLRPKTVYQCLVVASTKAAAGQDPVQCERYSRLSSRVRTLARDA